MLNLTKTSGTDNTYVQGYEAYGGCNASLSISDSASRACLFNYAMMSRVLRRPALLIC
jgi:hypothetical protein